MNNLNITAKRLIVLLINTLKYLILTVDSHEIELVKYRFINLGIFICEISTSKFLNFQSLKKFSAERK